MIVSCSSTDIASEGHLPNNSDDQSNIVQSNYDVVASTIDLCSNEPEHPNGSHRIYTDNPSTNVSFGDHDTGLHGSHTFQHVGRQTIGYTL